MSSSERESPLDIASAESLERAQEPAREAEQLLCLKHGSFPTLLLVEDDLHLRLAAARYLQRSFRVLSVTTASEALHVLDSNSVDMLLCDFRLPDMNGDVVVRHASNLEKIPRIVVMSGEVNPLESFSLCAAGALSFVLKPCSLEEIKAAIDEARVVRPNIRLHAALQVGSRTLPEVEQEVREAMTAQAMHQAVSQRAASRLLGWSRQRLQQFMANGRPTSERPPPK